jgi:putative transposase
MSDNDMLSIARMADILGVARSSFYYQHKQPEKDDILKAKIEAVQREHPAYGHRRIALELGINKKRVLRVMRQYDLFPTVWANGKKKPSKSKKDSGVPNLAKHRCAIAPNSIWAGDFTYLKFQGQFLYLATVMDVFTREIIAWDLGTRHTSALVQDVLTAAIQTRARAPDIFHSDQGSEYTSQACQELLKKYNILPSHSPKGRPWHNGYQESFYNSFKRELGHINRFSHLEYLYEAISSLIHYYNHKRIHSALKMSPKQFHDKHISTH